MDQHHPAYPRGGDDAGYAVDPFVEDRTGAGQGVGIKVYGIAPYTSYMYPGGLDLQLITPPA